MKVSEPTARLDAWVRRWWHGEAGALGHVADLALAPAELLYRGITAARNVGYTRGWLAAERAPMPVVSIGNLGVGGAGKTPFAAWLVERLARWGERPAVVIRGYGDDEVLLHRELNPGVPVYATPRRIAGVREAAAAGATVAVLDDGFQHRAIARDLDVVLVSAEAWTARRRLLPRGPWREGTRALGRAGVVVITRKSAPVERARAVAAEVRGEARDVVLCEIRPAAVAPLAGGELRALDWLLGSSILAVAALADPRPFLANLADAGAAVESEIFADHYAFTSEDAARLVWRAAGRPIVMTHKDAVKLAPLLSREAEAYVLRQEVRIEEGGDRLDAALTRGLGRGA